MWKTAAALFMLFCSNNSQLSGNSFFYVLFPIPITRDFDENGPNECVRVWCTYVSFLLHKGFSYAVNIVVQQRMLHGQQYKAQSLYTGSVWQYTGQRFFCHNIWLSKKEAIQRPTDRGPVNFILGWKSQKGPRFERQNSWELE